MKNGIKKIIPVLIMALVMNMTSISIFAAEDVEKNIRYDEMDMELNDSVSDDDQDKEYEDDDGDEEDDSSSSNDRPENDEFSDTSSENIKDEEDFNGWKFETSDPDIARVQWWTKPFYFIHYGIIKTPNIEWKVYKGSEGHSVGGYRAKSVNVKFTGSVMSKDLTIIPDSGLVYIGGSESNNYNNNSVNIHISRRDSEGKDGDGKSSVKVRVQRALEDFYMTMPTPLEPSHKQYYISGIYSKCVHVTADPGLSIKTKVDGDYVVYTISDAMRFNNPDGLEVKTIGDYNVSYYSKIANFGKKYNKNKFESVFGPMTVSDNNGNVYKVTKVKVVRLKNAPTDQGPFPTLSNAAIQITGLQPGYVDSYGIIGTYPDKNYRKKEAKAVLKKIKKATKVKKNAGSENQVMPIIIYPRRVTDDVLVEGKVLVKNKKHVSISYTTYVSKKKIVIKDGAKDSFKTGTHSVKIEKIGKKKVISINSADYWSGYDGLTKYKIKK